MLNAITSSTTSIPLAQHESANYSIQVIALKCLAQITSLFLFVGTIYLFVPIVFTKAVLVFSAAFLGIAFKIGVIFLKSIQTKTPNTTLLKITQILDHLSTFGIKKGGCIKSIAIRCIAEAGILFLLVGLPSIFILSLSVQISLFSIISSTMLLNAAFRIGAVFLKSINSNPSFAFHLGDNILWLSDFLFPHIDLGTRAILFHECGHAGAATALYNNAEVQICIDPFKSGMTHYFSDTLSPVGRFLGQRKSDLLVSGAGAFVTTCISTLGLILSVKMEKYPNLRNSLIICSIISLVAEIFYALSALEAAINPDVDLDSHDFIALWKGGIHPLIPVIGMIAIPLITYIAVDLLTNRNQSDCSNN